MTIYASLRLSMIIYAYLRLSNTIYDFLLLSVIIYGWLWPKTIHDDLRSPIRDGLYSWLSMLIHDCLFIFWQRWSKTATNVTDHKLQSLHLPHAPSFMHYIDSVHIMYRRCQSNSIYHQESWILHPATNCKRVGGDIVTCCIRVLMQWKLLLFYCSRVISTDKIPTSNITWGKLLLFDCSRVMSTYRVPTANNNTSPPYPDLPNHPGRDKGVGFSKLGVSAMGPGATQLQPMPNSPHSKSKFPGDWSCQLAMSTDHVNLSCHLILIEKWHQIDPNGRYRFWRHSNVSFNVMKVSLWLYQNVLPYHLSISPRNSSAWSLDGSSNLIVWV